MNKNNCESIKVNIRIRPKLKEEKGKEICIKSNNQYVVVNNRLKCKYDIVFPPSSKQEDVVNNILPLIDNFIQGYNCTLFAYGQTGSGKTYSMFGKNLEQIFLKGKSFKSLPYEYWGIIPRSIEYIFESLDELSTSSDTFNYSLYLSFLQIYNDGIYDLLQDKSMKNPLVLKEEKKRNGKKNNGVNVEGLSEFRIYSLEDVMSLLNKGIRNRSTSITEYNVMSSRSHAVLQLRLETEDINDENEVIHKSSKCNLVDLAGSEKWNTKLDLNKKRTNELININTSLLTLGNCISALGSNSSYIPYRESKLTRLLQDSLGGNTKTLLLVTISPLSEYEEESVSALKFGDRAKKVMIRANINCMSNINHSNNPSQNKEILALHKTCAELRLENLDLKRQLLNVSRNTKYPQINDNDDINSIYYNIFFRIKRTIKFINKRIKNCTNINTIL